MPYNRILLALLAASAWCCAQTQQPPHEMSHGDHMQHRFDNPEQWAKSFDDPGRDAWQMPDKVIEALHLKPGQVVADLGAGTGYFTVRLARSQTMPKVYGVDIEPSMVNYIRERFEKEGLKNVVAMQASDDDAHLPERVDMVLIVDTYHHIGNREAYFGRLGKSLKPGGRVAIIDFKKGAPDGPPEEFRFPPEKVKAEMAKAGYALDQQLDFLPRQQFLIFRLAGEESR